jgi:hypothetical protein
MAYRRPRARGVGVYPGDACYDPSRPSWLPYWLDTNSENLCRFQVYPTVTTLAPTPAPPMPTGPGAPQTPAQMTTPGAWTPAQSATDQAAANTTQFQDFINQLAGQKAFGGTGATPGQCDTAAQSWLDPSTWCTERWLMALLVTGLGAPLLLQVLGGRR